MSRIGMTRLRSLIVLLSLALVLGFSLRAAAVEAANSSLSSTAPDDDLTTPRRAITAFLEASDRADWERAIRVLDIPAHASSARKSKAIEQAKQLQFLLTRRLWIDVDALSDDMNGTAEDGADTERFASAPLGTRDLPMTLKLIKGDPPRWVFSATTLARVRELYEDSGPSALEKKIPDSLQVTIVGMAAWQWIGLLLAIVVAIVIGRMGSFAILYLAARVAARTRVAWDDELVVAMRSLSRLLLTLLTFHFGAEPLALPTAARGVVAQLAESLFVIAWGWVVIRTVGVVATSLERRATRDSIDLEEALQKARGIRTQVRVLKRVVDVAVVLVVGALILMQFEVVRNVGVSLLASAGVAGIVLGLAAQRTIGSVIAGIQLSVTQPIRIGDAVMLEKEFGTIEEITLTYVVLKVWDERRLIVPMTRFFEQPFQNWTKSSAQLHGTVMLYADWTLPVSALRDELDRILAGNPRWDTRTKAVHVTETTKDVIEVRILVSAADASRLFELRADVRERLVLWLQGFEGGRFLPRQRTELSAAAGTVQAG